MQDAFRDIFPGSFWGFSAPAEPEKAKEANNPLRFETEGIVVDRAPGPRPNVTVFCAGSGEQGAVFSAGNRFHYTRVRPGCQCSEDRGSVQTRKLSGGGAAPFRKPVILRTGTRNAEERSVLQILRAENFDAGPEPSGFQGLFFAQIIPQQQKGSVTLARQVLGYRKVHRA